MTGGRGELPGPETSETRIRGRAGRPKKPSPPDAKADAALAVRRWPDGGAADGTEATQGRMWREMRPCVCGVEVPRYGHHALRLVETTRAGWVRMPLLRCRVPCGPVRHEKCQRERTNHDYVPGWLPSPRRGSRVVREGRFQECGDDVAACGGQVRRASGNPVG